MNAPFKPLATVPPCPSSQPGASSEGVPGTHAYSRTCNCDACFEAWLTMPEPTPEERQAMARRFSMALFPAGGGELLTDWPKVSFPDLDEVPNEQG